MLDLLQAVLNGLLIGAVFALVAVGLTIIFGVMDIVNFAHGELLMLGMYVTFFAWSLLGLDPLVAIPVAAIALAAAGVLTYRGLIRPVLGKPMLSQIMVTFGLLTLLRGLAQFLWTPNSRTVADPLVGDVRVELGRLAFGGPQLVAAAGALICTAAVALFVSRTETGNALQATGEDAQAAALLGIDADRMNALAWLIGGGTVGVAGALLMNSYSVSPDAGAAFGLIAFVAVALGGFGSVIGAGLAGLALGVVQGVVGLYASAYSLAAVLALYLAVILVRPQGLLGTR
ncbi:MAG: branched-chain amino acid ABC transporter permease [Thermoleophilaceae bacterium]